MVRIIHTADWHLGKSLEGRSRLGEQAGFVDELVMLADLHAVDMIIVAGDVFDSSNPPAAAERLFYQALDQLAQGGRRAVVVIAGNHDHPERLAAALELAQRYGIVLAGLPGLVIPTSPMADERVSVLHSGPNWLELSIPGCSHNAVIALLPYPSESRLQEALTDSLAEEDLQKAYAEKIKVLLAQAGENFSPHTVNLVVSHLYVAGGLRTESERDISLGGALAVGGDVFPPASDYVALGHLHRCQEIKGAGPLIRYAGSPLAYSFSEAGQAKSVSLIELEPGQSPRTQELFLTRGQPLVCWRADSLDEVRAWCEEGRDGQAWIDLEVKVISPLSLEESAELRNLHKGFVNPRVVLPAADPAVLAQAPDCLSPEDLFRNFYYSRHGVWPEPEMLKLFLTLLGDIDEGTGGEVSS